MLGSIALHCTVRQPQFSVRFGFTEQQPRQIRYIEERPGSDPENCRIQEGKKKGSFKYLPCLIKTDLAYPAQGHHHLVSLNCNSPPATAFLSSSTPEPTVIFSAETLPLIALSTVGTMRVT